MKYSSYRDTDFDKHNNLCFSIYNLSNRYNTIDFQRISYWLRDFDNSFNITQ